jgi:anion-transporting  ArsA/GET3 family ATPase
MKISAVVSTKGGVGKTTVEANLVTLCADAGLQTLHELMRQVDGTSKVAVSTTRNGIHPISDERKMAGIHATPTG